MAGEWLVVVVSLPLSCMTIMAAGPLTLALPSFLRLPEGQVPETELQKNTWVVTRYTIQAATGEAVELRVTQDEWRTQDTVPLDVLIHRPEADWAGVLAFDLQVTLHILRTPENPLAMDLAWATAQHTEFKDLVYYLFYTIPSAKDPAFLRRLRHVHVHVDIADFLPLTTHYAMHKDVTDLIVALRNMLYEDFIVPFYVAQHKPIALGYSYWYTHAIDADIYTLGKGYTGRTADRWETDMAEDPITQAHAERRNTPEHLK